jgi:hypothetical protein
MYDTESGIAVPDIFRYLDALFRTAEGSDVDAVFYFDRQLLAFQVGEFGHSKDFATREFFKNDGFQIRFQGFGPIIFYTKIKIAIAIIVYPVGRITLLKGCNVMVLILVPFYGG